MREAAPIQCVDPDARALIQRCAAALVESGLGDLIDDMVDAGVFHEGRTLKNGLGNTYLIGLGPMTELFLLECADVARRPWPQDLKRRWITTLAKAIGFE